MKRWYRKAAELGARMELSDHEDGWSCYVVLADDTSADPFMRPRTEFAVARFRDDAIRAALASYAAGGIYR